MNLQQSDGVENGISVITNQTTILCQFDGNEPGTDYSNSIIYTSYLISLSFKNFIEISLVLFTGQELSTTTSIFNYDLFEYSENSINLPIVHSF